MWRKRHAGNVADIILDHCGKLCAGPWNYDIKKSGKVCICLLYTSKILQKSCFREEVRFQGERRSIRQRPGDSLDGPINLQLEMLGEKYGTETTGTEYGKNPVLAEQNNFFYAKSAPFIVWQIRISCICL